MELGRIVRAKGLLNSREQGVWVMFGGGMWQNVLGKENLGRRFYSLVYSKQSGGGYIWKLFLGL